MNPYSLYIGPAGPFGIFPSSRLKRRPSHCELELAEGECEFMSAWGPCLFVLHLSMGRDTASAHRQTQNSAHGLSTHVFTMHQTTVPQPVPHNHSHPTSHRVLAKGMAWETQNDSFIQTHCHPGSRHMTTMQDTTPGPQPHRR